MAVVEATSPAAAHTGLGVTTTAISSPSFTPPAGSLLIVAAGVEIAGAYTGTPTITITNSASLTATQVAFQREPTSKFTYGGIWSIPVTTSAAMTVTATRSEAGSGGISLNVRVLTGTGTTPGGAVVSETHSAAPTGTITPTVVGSIVYIQVTNDSQVALTATAATTQVDVFRDTTSSGTVVVGKATTASLSALTLGWTGNNAGDLQTVNLVEVVPAVASSPRPVRAVNAVARIRSAHF